jgi:Holliday junction resolvasome RuvABC DNA-binding subunit
MPNVVLVAPGQSPNNQAKRQAEAAAALVALGGQKRKNRKASRKASRKNRKATRKSRK